MAHSSRGGRVGEEYYVVCLGFLLIGKCFFSPCFRTDWKPLSVGSRHVSIKQMYSNAVFLSTKGLRPGSFAIQEHSYTIRLCSFLFKRHSFYQNIQDEPNLKINFTNVGIQKKM